MPLYLFSVPSPSFALPSLLFLQLNVQQLQFESGKMIPAAKFGQADEGADLGELSDEEKAMEGAIKEIWKGILAKEIEDDTDFFKSGAGSMDVTR